MKVTLNFTPTIHFTTAFLLCTRLPPRTLPTETKVESQRKNGTSVNLRNSGLPSARRHRKKARCERCPHLQSARTSLRANAAALRRATSSCACQEGRCKATSKRQFKVPWCEGGPPNHHDDEVDSDQEVVNKKTLSLVHLGR